MFTSMWLQEDCIPGGCSQPRVAQAWKEGPGARSPTASCSVSVVTAKFVLAHGLSLVAAGRGCSLVVVPGSLIAVASLVAEHRL